MKARRDVLTTAKCVRCVRTLRFVYGNAPIEPPCTLIDNSTQTWLTSASRAKFVRDFVYYRIRLSKAMYVHALVDLLFTKLRKVLV